MIWREFLRPTVVAIARTRKNSKPTLWPQRRGLASRWPRWGRRRYQRQPLVLLVREGEVPNGLGSVALSMKCCAEPKIETLPQFFDA